MTRVRVTIDRLRLKGLEGISDKALAQALKTELAVALSDPSLHAGRSHRSPVVKLGPLPLQPGAAGVQRFSTALARNIVKKVKV